MNEYQKGINEECTQVVEFKKIKHEGKKERRRRRTMDAVTKPPAIELNFSNQELLYCTLFFFFSLSHFKMK